MYIKLLEFENTEHGWDISIILLNSWQLFSIACYEAYTEVVIFNKTTYFNEKLKG